LTRTSSDQRQAEHQPRRGDRHRALLPLVVEQTLDHRRGQQRQQPQGDSAIAN
jgi:hypothetical protein